MTREEAVEILMTAREMYGGFVDIWGKSAGSRWRRCGGENGNGINGPAEHTELFVTDVENETGKLQTFALIAALP